MSMDATGTVQIKFDGAHSGLRVFTFNAASAAALCQRKDPAETLARIALAQAHQMAAQNDGGAGGPAPLNLDLKPWVGDLTDEPYGGATDGYSTRGAKPKSAVFPDVPLFPSRDDAARTR
ncbi:hypothetical protein ACHAC9_01910 [Massilia sp. CMS3.1]|uniref:hypothetical protein n=1 Tax=Massilia sp. CMS3.1 TaxID=3373083 RepID=UPI003EE6C8D8